MQATFQWTKTIVPGFFVLMVTAAALDTTRHHGGHYLDQRRLHTLLSNTPSAKLHVTIKHKSLKIHGQSEYNIFGNSIVSDTGGSVLYNVRRD